MAENHPLWRLRRLRTPSGVCHTRRSARGNRL